MEYWAWFNQVSTFFDSVRSKIITMESNRWLIRNIVFSLEKITLSEFKEITPVWIRRKSYKAAYSSEGRVSLQLRIKDVLM